MGALVLLAAASASGVLAQIPDDRYVEQVRTLLERYQTVLEGEGLSRTHDLHYVKVNKGASNEFTLTLKQSVEYSIVAVCDADCDNVDVTLFDENNNEIDMDTKGDRTPVVQVTPRWTGEFRIVVSVPGCRASRCTVGIGVYGKEVRS